MATQLQHTGSPSSELRRRIRRLKSTAQWLLVDGYQPSQPQLDAFQKATADVVSGFRGEEVASDNLEVVLTAGLRGENLQRLLTCVDAVAALLAKIEEVRTQSGVLLANLGWLGQLLLVIFGGHLLWLVAGLAANLGKLPRPVYTGELRAHLAVEQLVLLAGLVSPILKPIFERQTGVNISYAVPVALWVAGVVGTLMVVRNTPARIAADAAKLQDDINDLQTKVIAAPAQVHQLAPHPMLQQAAGKLATDGDTTLELLGQLL